MGSVPEPAPSPAGAAGSPDAPPQTPSDAGASGPSAGRHGSPGRSSEVRMPWQGKPRKIDILCWAGITLSGLYYLAILPFRAALVGTHPIALEILNGSTEAIVAAAAFARVGHGTLLVVMLASIPGLMKFDPLYWLAGRLWGERVIELMFSRGKRTTKYLDWVNRWGRWVIWPAIVLAPFLPLPSAVFYIVAGWSGMSLVTFLILDLIGSLMWAGMLAGLGYELGHHAVVVAQTVSRYGLWFSIAIVVLIVVSQVRRARAMHRGFTDPPAPAETPEEN
jgi:membrane protein DedA with SNARE-associated domain